MTATMHPFPGTVQSEGLGTQSHCPIPKHKAPYPLIHVGGLWEGAAGDYQWSRGINSSWMFSKQLRWHRFMTGVH